ncbi:NF-kappa-B inhibitor-like protein [Melia azedarach]|uniref:NF-kappa-B inhibitor-like protein n=1 Tax=Melia azedarach TaxID=155640 RepID=A0ACC1YPH2_MELAZ|nr:NF-kappa-B inhibitor-like protein [Melia azedarach]
MAANPMETLSRVGFLTNYSHSHFSRFSPLPRTQKPLSKKTAPAFSSVLRTSIRPVGKLAEEDVFQIFFKDRELNGDFISKASDMFWQRGVGKFVDADGAKLAADTSEQIDQVIESDNDDGFLKLSTTHEWLLGDDSAPINKKPTAKALQDDSERRKKLNFLKYEALKRELMLLSVGIGTACTGYCLIALSVKATLSYAVGVLFRNNNITRRTLVLVADVSSGIFNIPHFQCSCLYLQLLYQHADSLSKEMVPQIFMQKKSKKIGIRSEDLLYFLERSIKGSGVALSSPRLVIPAAIFGLWVLSHKYFANDLFDFQLVPALVGMFVYKAAALVQVYRDNEDLQFVFPDNEGGSSD